ncbi:MAG: nucleoside hydrolase [Anaerolineae bacterium]|nr:nucleoside hydrolase [Anaerolineae bacterium]
MSEKVILDTDIGSDIDDAVCLAYLLAQPRCDLVGVTTVSGEPHKRAELVSALCQAAGKAVPIYPGIEKPLLSTQRQPLVPQAAMLDRWPHETDFPQGEAIEFLRATIRAHPGEVTLLGIGPLTNIALLFAIDPEIPALLKRLVLMAGVFTNQLPGVGPLEWNAICDPYAAAMVYNTPVQVHRSVGLDVTCQVTMDSDEVRERFQVGLLRPVLDFAEVWFRERPIITFHDPLAATVLFDADICHFERGTVDVELTAPRLRGLTYFDRREPGRHEVALAVNPQRFFEHYFACFA